MCKPGQTQKECILEQSMLSLSGRESSYQERNKGACQGNQKLNKNAFISMLGSSSYSRPPVAASNADLEAARITKAVEEQGGDQRRAANALGISIHTLKRKLSPPAPSAASYDEKGSPNLTRRYFENLTAPWKITSFNTSNGEVCAEIASKSTVVHVSAKVSKNY
jgi:DNA-binding protein Fis